MIKYKTFDDLEFKSWLDPFEASDSLLTRFQDAKQATMTFENGYGVSVLFGDIFYSDGESTYELAVTLEGRIVYPFDVCPNNDVLGYITKEQVSEAMMKIQDLK